MPACPQEEVLPSEEETSALDEAFQALEPAADPMV